MLTLTDRARDALVAADAAARRFNPEARVRLRTAAAGLVADLADEAGPGEVLVELGGLELIVQSDLEGTVDAGEHNVLALVPGGETGS